MDLKTRILEDVKVAMKSQEKDRLAVLRLVAAAFKQKEVDERISLDDAAVLTILEKMIKQRKESITLFEQGKRTDLAQKEQQEINVIQAYLPEQLSSAEIEQLIAAAISATGAASIKDMGKVMAAVKPKLQGRADMAAVGAKIKAKLS
jgi:hypothetical protein